MNIKKKLTEIKNYIINNFKVVYPFTMIALYSVVILLVYSIQSIPSVIFWSLMICGSFFPSTFHIIAIMHVLSPLIGVMAGYRFTMDARKKMELVVDKNVTSSLQYCTQIIALGIFIFFQYIFFNSMFGMIYPLIYLNLILFNIALITLTHLLGIIAGIFGFMHIMGLYVIKDIFPVNET